MHELGAGVLGELRERHAVGVAERERLGDRERPVRELGVGRDERQVDPVARERAQGEQAFEACHSTAGDDDVHRAAPYTFVAVKPQPAPPFLRMRARPRGTILDPMTYASERRRCPLCGEPIGVYEPVWRLAPRIGAERTSWLNLRGRAGTGRFAVARRRAGRPPASYWGNCPATVCGELIGRLGQPRGACADAEHGDQVTDRGIADPCPRSRPIQSLDPPRRSSTVAEGVHASTSAPRTGGAIARGASG